MRIGYKPARLKALLAISNALRTLLPMFLRIPATPRRLLTFANMTTSWNTISKNWEFQSRFQWIQAATSKKCCSTTGVKWLLAAQRGLRWTQRPWNSLWRRSTLWSCVNCWMQTQGRRQKPWTSLGKAWSRSWWIPRRGSESALQRLTRTALQAAFLFFNLWDTPTSNAEAGSPSSLVPSPIQSKGHNITHRKEICSICTVLSSSFMLFYNLRTRRNKRRIILKKSSRGWRRRFGLVKTSMIRQPPAVTSWIWSKSKSKKKHLRIRYFCFLVILD